LAMYVRQDTPKHCFSQQLLANSVSKAWTHLVDAG
jgi:hypothetical protein